MTSPGAICRRRVMPPFLLMQCKKVLMFLLLTMTSAMIYLEEFDGALLYDAGMSTTTMGSPDHYLPKNSPPIATTTAIKSDAPSAMPTTIFAPSATTNQLINVMNNTNTSIINETTTPSPSPRTTDETISISPSSSTTMTDHDGTNSPSATATPTAAAITPGTTFFNTRGRRNMDEAQKNDVHYSSLEAHGQGTSRPTSSSTTFTSSLLSSLSSSAVSIPSTIPSTTSLTSLSSPSSSDTGFYFNDLSIIYNPRNFVYYDSKQARFGVDLGPRGNAEFVNIMLPPRWYFDDSSLGLQEQLDTKQTVGSGDVWWSVNEGSYNASTTTGNIFNDNPNNNTSTLGEDSIQSSSSSSGPKNNVSDVGVYFCLEDYIKWRKDISAANTASSSATTMNVSTISPSPQPNPADRIDSTRPLTILVRRGRCTFESKAHMAMVINEILSNSGRSNRIDHIIIYNNGTDDDNITDNKEELVDMGYEREMEDDDITVGLLYITSSSGVDLIRRITERQVSTFISPHLEVSMFSTEPNAHTLNRRHLKESESSKPAWENDTITEQYSAKYHDKQISHGWWFPATLTRFCYSCGAEMQYGLVWEDVTDIHRFNDDGSETSPTQPFAGGYPQEYFSDWFLYIRQFMIAILVLLLVGPILVFALRWYVVGGTFRIVTDENGVRRFRMVAPNLEAFVNGTPGTVEINGTKLDRAQVFSLPEIEYSECVDEENSASSNVNQTSFNDECGDQTRSPMQDDEGDRQNSTPQAAPSNAPPTRSGRFISSSCCSICIDEFTLGERIRMLPRCGHECILPWLTERQGCCPVCKVPVLPDELQRTGSIPRRLGTSRNRM